MITVTRTGPRAAAIAADMRALPAKTVPLVAAKALTFTAQKGQQAVIERMPKVFEGGATRYTLNSTRIETATPQKLQSRVAIKDFTSNNGTDPEDYLFPQVYGGPRKEKRFERNLRLAGVLASGMRAVLGQGAKVDAYGNMPRGEIQRILTATRTAFDPAQRKSDSARSRKNARNAPYFVGGLDDVRMVGGELSVRKGAMQPGIYRRDGPRSIKPVLIFVRKQPQYRPRLDFEGIVRDTAQREFEPTFARLLRAATS